MGIPVFFSHGLHGFTQIFLYETFILGLLLPVRTARPGGLWRRPPERIHSGRGWDEASFSLILHHEKYICNNNYNWR